MTPSVIENLPDTESIPPPSASLSQGASPLAGEHKPSKHPRLKLAAAGALLAVSATLAIGSGIELFKDRSDTRDSGSYRMDQAMNRERGFDAQSMPDKSQTADLPVLGSERQENHAAQAPAAESGGVSQSSAAPRPYASLTPAESRWFDPAKDSALKEKTGRALARDMDINPVLPPLTGFGDPAHGYNAPAYLLKQASMQLEVGNIQESFGRISALTEKYHGYVVDSGMSNYESSQPSATLSLKLPADKLSAALAELDGLGTVRNQQIKTEDLWLQIKRQALEVERAQGQAKATEPGASRREQEYQIKQQKLEQLRLEQMLKMATVSLGLAERAPFWDLRPLGEELRSKSFASLQTTTRLLAEALLFLPPLLLFLGLAWLGWMLLRQVLISRLGLLSERSLGAIYVSALIFFPICAVGPQALGPVLLFGLLLGAGWASRTLYLWLKNRQAQRRAAVANQALAPEPPTV